MSIAPELETLVLGPEQNGIRMTPEEFDAIDECNDLYRYELISGVLIANPVSLPAERGPTTNSVTGCSRIRRIIRVEAFSMAPLVEEYIRTATSRRRADRVIWVGLGRQPNPKTDVPNIAVEFVSEGRRNWRRGYILKCDEYIGVGVEEYWVIDRFRRTLTVFPRTPDGRSTEHLFRETDIYRPDLLPGFELPLATLLTIADRRSDAERAE